MQSKPRLLLVEDNQTIASTLAMILEASNFEVAVVYDGLSALASFRASRPDLVIADIVLPGMDGIELATRVREAGPTPVLLVSGQLAAAELVRAADPGAAQFRSIQKPVHPTVLIETIKEMLQKTAPLREQDN